MRSVLCAKNPMSWILILAIYLFFLLTTLISSFFLPNKIMNLKEMNSDMNSCTTTASKERVSQTPISQPQMIMPLKSRMSSSCTPQEPVIICLDPASFGLPNGWIVEERYRSSSKYPNMSDKVLQWNFSFWLGF